MSFFTDKIVILEGVKYYYSERMHKRVNELADKFYQYHGYRSTGMDYSESNHPQEKLMYSMALAAFIFNGKIRN